MRIALRGRETRLDEVGSPLPLTTMVAEARAWEVEIGFGKGRYLLARAADEPDRAFLGIEVSAPYYRRVRDRVWKRRLDNVVLIRGEAVYLLAAVVPCGFAEVVHVYFPDPWPKARHRARRLFGSETIDLLIGLLKPGGRLAFATDAGHYGETVAELLAGHPAVRLRRLEGGWPQGARTNYERKFERLGRRIVRLEAERSSVAGASLLHPLGRRGVVSAASIADDRKSEPHGSAAGR